MRISLLLSFSEWTLRERVDNVTPMQSFFGTRGYISLRDDRGLRDVNTKVCCKQQCLGWSKITDCTANETAYYELDILNATHIDEMNCHILLNVTGMYWLLTICSVLDKCTVFLRNNPHAPGVEPMIIICVSQDLKVARVFWFCVMKRRLFRFCHDQNRSCLGRGTSCASSCAPS